MTHRPTLKTDRFTLSPLVLSDEPAIEHYVSDIRIAWMVSSITHPNPEGATRAFLERVVDPANPDVTWSIRQEDTLLGVITLRGNGELGYWLGPDHWGKGIMTEAGKAVVDHAFARGETRVHAQRFADNEASGRVLEKLGLNKVGFDEPEFCPTRDAIVEKYLYERKNDG